MNNKIALTLSSLLAIGNAYAVGNENAAFISYSGTSSAELEDKPGDPPGVASDAVENERFNLKIPLALFGNKERGLAISLRYQRDDFEFKTANSVGGVVHMAALSLAYFWQGKDWQHSVLIEPGVYSDWKHVDRNDVRTNALYVAKKQHSDKLTYIFGAGYSQAFGEPTGFPVVGLVYEPNDNWTLSATFPTTSALYRFTPTVEIYVAAYPAGGKWNIDGSKQLKLDIDLVEEAHRFGLGANVNLGAQLWFSVEGGSVFARKVTAFSGSTKLGERKGEGDPGYFQAQLSYRFGR